MKRYSEYKDSGVKWIGEIPEHWKITTLKRHCKVNTGGTPSMSESRFYESPTIPWFTPGDLSENLKLSDSTRKLSKTVIKEGVCKLFPINTVYFVGIGATVGKVGYSEHSAYCNQQINALIPYDINYKYLTYYLVFCKPEIVRIASASTLPIINQSKTGNIPLIELSIPEQEAIVTYLDSKVAKIDEYISIAEKKIAALEELKQTIIAEAVTRGIHKDVPMKDSGVKWIGMIPEHWKIVAIKRFSEIILGKMLDKTNGNEQQYLCAKDVHFDEINLTDLKKMYFSPEEQSKYRVRKGDLLVVEGGACGTCAILRTDVNDIFIQNSIMIVRGDKTKCVNDFIAYSIQALVQKGYTESVCNKATIMHFTKEKLGNTLISLPPLPEQQEIVTYLDSKVANINQLCQAERSQIEKLKEYKQRLISDVVTGKVKVTNNSLNGRV